MAPKIVAGLPPTVLLLFLLLAIAPSVHSQAVSSVDLAKILPPLTTIQPSGNSPSQLSAAAAETLGLTSAAGSSQVCSAYNTAYQELSQSLNTLTSALNIGDLLSIAISYCQATTYNGKAFIDVQTPGSASSVASALASLTGQQTVSPTNTVAATNANNAPYFITCPNPPPSSPQTNTLLYAQDGSFVGGDQCLNSVGGIPTVVTLNTQIKNPPISIATIGVPTLALPWARVTPLEVANPGILSTIDFIYTPEVDGGLSNGFSTNSYIFQSVPSFAQHAIWSWSGPFANLNAIPPQSASVSGSGTYLYTTYPNDVPDPFPLSCWIDYTYNEKTSLDWVHNTNLQFLYQSGVSPSGTPTTNSIGTPIFPYLFLNFNITTNSLAGGLIPNLSTLSYGVFTPYTYNSPYNSIETFPLDIPSQLMVNIRVSPQQSQSIWSKIGDFFKSFAGGASTASGIYAMNSFSTNGLAIDPNNGLQFITPQYKIISVATMPNDYIYFLFQAMWTGNQLVQGNYYIEAARAYAPGYYQNTTVVHTTTTSTMPPAIVCRTVPSSGCSEASLQQQWATSWNSYWANALTLASNPIHLIQGNVVVANSGSQLINSILQSGGSSLNVNGALVAGSLIPVQGTPLNITTDYQGDIFVVGQASAEWFGSSGKLYDTYLAKFQNVNPSNTVCTNTSCFKTTYWDVNEAKQIYTSSSSSGGGQQSTTKGSFLEIAASPTGAQVYLAGPDGSSGTSIIAATPSIAVFDGNSLNYESSISLTYSGTGASSLATLDILHWLESNGLYNQSIPWISQATQGVTGMVDSPNYHHVLGIADVDGYLYILDDWAGSPSNTGSATASTGTISFNILMLRVMNSTGAELPISASTVPDLVIQQQCTPSPNSGLIGASGGSVQCFTSPPDNSLCPTQGGVVGGAQCMPEIVPFSGCTFDTGYSYGCFSAPVNEGQTVGLGLSKLFGAETYQNYYVLATGGGFGQNVYPPYGWILSANILANNVGSSSASGGGFLQSTSFCSTSACTYTSNNLANYHGNYYPLGPELLCATSSGYGGCSSASNLPQGVGFSVNYNETAAFLFPNSITENLGYGELLLANFPVENYTKPLNGYPGYACYLSTNVLSSGGTSFSACNGYSPLIANAVEPIYYLMDPFKYYENMGSQQLSAVQSQFSSAFAGGSGSPSAKSGASAACLGQVANGLIPTSCQNYNSAANTITIPNGLTFSSLPPITVANALVPQLSSAVSGFTIIPYEYQTTITQSISGTSPEDTQLEAMCNLYALSGGPYAYAAIYAFCVNICNAASAILPAAYSKQNPSPATWINFDYVFSQKTASPPNEAPIEGGATYLKYTGGSNNNGYYTPNLSDAGVVLDPHIFLNITGDRLFGNIYINITSSATSNAQLVLNATQQLTYLTNFNTYESTGFGGFSSQNPLGSGPSLTYVTISSQPVSPPNYGTQYALTNLLSSVLSGGGLNSLTNVVSFPNSAVGFSYNTVPANAIGISVVNLFNWYKYEVYDNPLKLLINGSESPSSLSSLIGNQGGALSQLSSNSLPNLPYGYRRLILALQDRFDNTIYVPIDADIANQTVILLNVTPVINPINPNLTTINVNGYAGYYAYNAYGNQFYPLANSPIYLYYDNNIDYNGLASSSSSQPAASSLLGSAAPQLTAISSLSTTANVVYAQLCAFGNPLSPYANGNFPTNCALASPINPSQQASATVITYSPSYNSTGTCMAPAQSLLQQTNFNCNIYNAGGLTNTCPAGPNGQQQYCFVQSFTGNGLCTSQLGLFNATSTNAIGYFSTNIVACGIATATVSAQFYGTPGPEPIFSTQPPLTQSATVLGGNILGGQAQQASSLLSTSTNGFAVYNYVWTPNQTGEVVSVGLFELGYGSINAVEILSLVGVVVVLGALKIAYSRHAHPKKALRKRAVTRARSR